MAETIRIGVEPLSWVGYEAVVYRGATVAIDPANAAARHRAVLEALVGGGGVVYSVNTGYGADASRTVPADAIGRVQLNTVRSHAQGIGDPAPETIVRGQMLLKAAAYLYGPAGLRPVVAERLVDLLNRRIHPVVPLRGSQSASGDLIPNAHVALALIGEGEVWLDGARVAAEAAGIDRWQPAMKEGVALTNDCSFAAALAIDAIRASERLVEQAELVAAMTLQALRGYPDAYDERLIACRPHAGARAAAAAMRAHLAGSTLLRHPGRPHDPYSLRCIPQVHGAIRDALSYARAALTIEITSIGDNPVVIADDDATLSGGNIHGEPIAIPMDTLAIALCELAALSQRRTQHLVDCPFDIGLPAKLTADPSEQFGMLLHNTAAAALVSELRGCATPAATESIGVDTMEDHVSMAAVAARKARHAAGLARSVVAIELLCAAQALDFQQPGNASPAVRVLHRAVREHVSFQTADRPTSTARLEELLA